MEAPLYKVCKSYVYETAPNVDDEAANVSIDILLKILKGTIDFETAKVSIEALLGSSTPADKIIAIAQVDVNKPLSDVQIIPEKPDHGRRRARPWSSEEDCRLLAAIYKHGLDNWGQVVKIVGNGRTRPQCSQRWYRGIDPKINKSQWTAEEDQKLFSLVEELGTKVWSKIAHHMGTRSDVQCRYRYFQINKSKTQTRKNSSLVQRRQAHHVTKHAIPIQQIQPIQPIQQMQQMAPMQPMAQMQPMQPMREIPQQMPVQKPIQYFQPSFVEDLTLEPKKATQKKETSQSFPFIDFSEAFENLSYNSAFDLSSIDTDFSFL